MPWTPPPGGGDPEQMKTRGFRGRVRVPAVAKARREALDLPLDRLGEVGRRSGRDVTVRISRVLSVGRARRIELALLNEHHERALGVFPAHTALSDAAISSSVPPRCPVRRSRERQPPSALVPKHDGPHISVAQAASFVSATFPSICAL